jgi:hypothetical protein
MWEHLWIHGAGRGHKCGKMWAPHILGTNDKCTDPQVWENVGAGASAGCKCGNIC